MRINLVLFRDRNVGSTRIRLRLFDFMPKKFKFICKIDSNIDCDVLYIQKISTLQTIALTRKAIDANIPVIYDIDDNFSIAGIKSQEMCQLASIVTTDTEERAKIVRSVTTKPVIVVPTSIDYIDKPLPLKKITDGSLVTYGNPESLENVIPYFNVMNVPKHQIGSAPVIPHVDFTKWSLNNFISDLRKYDMCFLAHQMSSRKSPNRLIAAIAAGVPCIATETPAYSQVIKGACFDNLLVSSPEDINRAYDFLLTNRIEITNSMQEYVWDKFNPAKASLVMYNVLQMAVDNDKGSEMDRYWQNWDNGTAAKDIDIYWSNSKEEIKWRDKMGRRILKFTGKDLPLLEVGCGSGLIGLELLKQGLDKNDYIGGDVSDEMLKMSRERLSCDIRNIDIFNIDAPNESFDSVINIHVIQHLPDYKKPVSELCRITKKKLFIVSWFDQRDHIVLSSPSSKWSAQRFYNNKYSMNGLVEFIKKECGERIENINSEIIDNSVAGVIEVTFK